MNKKQKITISFLSASILAASSLVAFAANSGILAKAQYSNPAAGTWVHYAQTAPTSSARGTREYWVGCSEHTHVFSESEVPEGALIVDGESLDTTGFAENDDRWLEYRYDENHVGFDEYRYGAGSFLTFTITAEELGEKNWANTYLSNEVHYKTYGSDNTNEGRNVFRIELPRIDFTKYPTVTMNLVAPDWYNGLMMGPEADQLTYHTVYHGNKTEGKIKLTLGPSGVHMSFNSLEYPSQEAFSADFSNANIINGNASAYFYTQGWSDRLLKLSNIVLSTESSKVALVHLNGDKTAITTTNAKNVDVPSKIAYEIIDNNYGTDEDSLCVVGNDENTGAVTITMPTCNFNSYLATGVITFTFGVKNNGQTMYWGSGENRVSLGNNDTGSQANNSNGFVNWRLEVTSSSARIYNVYQERYIDVTLSEAMRAGTAGIVISGNDDCRWRQYFVTDIYWSLAL